MKSSILFGLVLAGFTIAAPIADKRGFEALAENPSKRSGTYDAIAENPTQVQSDDDVDLLAARIGYKRSGSYDAIAENPTQVQSDDDVDLLAARIGY